MVEWSIANWHCILFVFVSVIAVIYAFKTQSVIRWLEYACLVCEEELGKKTGQAKLRMAYDMFIDKYPGFSTIVPFAIFSKMVDVALKWVRGQLESNAQIRAKVEGD